MCSSIDRLIIIIIGVSSATRFGVAYRIRVNVTAQIVIIRTDGQFAVVNVPSFALHCFGAYVPNLVKFLVIEEPDHVKVTSHDNANS